MTSTQLHSHPVVAALAAIQRDLGLKDLPFATQLRLGIHGANWGKILAGTYDGSHSKALTKLQVALDAWLHPSGGDTEEGIVILRHVREALDAVEIALAADDEHRLIVLAGLRGSGKSRTISLVHAKHGGYSMEALPSWSGSYLNFLNKFAAGIGVDPSRNGGEAETAILTALGAMTHPVICVDEFNYFSPAGINFLKSILNQTTAVLVVGTIPHYLARMAYQTKTAQESAQLLRRAVCIIHIPAVTERDVCQIQQALFPDLSIDSAQAHAVAAAANRQSRLDSVCSILADADAPDDIPASILRHERGLKVTLKPGE